MKNIKLPTIATAATMIVGGLTSAPVQDTNNPAAGTRPGQGQILQRVANKPNDQITARLKPEQLARFEKWKKENHPLLEAIKGNQ
jgi:hypothetical protein